MVEELVKFTLLTRDVASYLVDRYSERKRVPIAIPQTAAAVSRMGRSIAEGGIV